MYLICSLRRAISSRLSVAAICLTVLSQDEVRKRALVSLPISFCRSLAILDKLTFMTAILAIATVSATASIQTVMTSAKIIDCSYLRSLFLNTSVPITVITAITTTDNIGSSHISVNIAVSSRVNCPAGKIL